MMPRKCRGKVGVIFNAFQVIFRTVHTELSGPSESPLSRQLILGTDKLSIIPLVRIRTRRYTAASHSGLTCSTYSFFEPFRYRTLRCKSTLDKCLAGSKRLGARCFVDWCAA